MIFCVLYCLFTDFTKNAPKTNTGCPVFIMREFFAYCEGTNCRTKFLNMPNWRQQKNNFFLLKTILKFWKFLFTNFQFIFLTKYLKKWVKSQIKSYLLTFLMPFFSKVKKTFLKCLGLMGFIWFNWPNSCLKEYFTSMLDFPKWNCLKMKFSSPLTKIGTVGAILISFK